MYFLAVAQNILTVVTYEYDVDGIREKKTAGNRTNDYVTLDGQVIRETITTGSSSTPIVINYMYDNSGAPYKVTMTAGSISYAGYYVLNQQGDVIAIIDAGGNVLVSYTYNAWGAVQVDSIQTSVQ